MSELEKLLEANNQITAELNENICRLVNSLSIFTGIVSTNQAVNPTISDKEWKKIMKWSEKSEA